MANLTYCIIEKSCNKLLIGKTYWKSIILPSILYGTNIINLSEDDIKDLQIIENNVYRSILNAQPNAPNVTLRGEIGASLMKKRIIQGRLSYIKSIMSGRNQIMHIILEKLINEKSTKWMKTTQKYLNEIKMNVIDIELRSTEEIKQKVIIWDNEQWTSEIKTKNTLLLYRNFKDKIQEEDIYDNIYDNNIVQSKIKHTTIERSEQTQKQRNSLYSMWKYRSTRRHIPLHTALLSIYQRENKHSSTATAIHTR